MQSLASDHFGLLGECGASDPSLSSARSLTYWDTPLGVLGSIIDTEALTVTLPPHKRGKLCERIACVASVSGFRFGEAGAQARRVPHARIVRLRPGSFFVQRMLASVGMPRITAGADSACRPASVGGRVALFSPTLV